MLELDCQVINFLLAIVELGQALVYRGIELKHRDEPDKENIIGLVYRYSVLFLFFFVGFVVGLPLWLAVFVMGRFNCTKACAEGMSKRPCCGVTSPCKLFPIPFTTTSGFWELLGFIGSIVQDSTGFIGSIVKNIARPPDRLWRPQDLAERRLEPVGRSHHRADVRLPGSVLGP